MTRRISYNRAKAALYAGAVLLASAFALALYSVPSEVPQIPEFPLFSLPFPLISVLLVLSTVLLAWGWIFHPRGSLTGLLIASASLLAAGVVLTVISYLVVIPLVIGDQTVYVFPYSTQAMLVLVVGPLTAIYGLVFSWAERREWAKRTKRETALDS